MARKLGVKYPGAIYHVMNSGNWREPIFRDNADRRLASAGPKPLRLVSLLIRCGQRPEGRAPQVPVCPKKSKTCGARLSGNMAYETDSTYDLSRDGLNG